MFCFRYIVMQSKIANRNKDYEGVAQKGTGGTGTYFP